MEQNNDQASQVTEQTAQTETATQTQPVQTNESSVQIEQTTASTIPNLDTTNADKESVNQVDVAPKTIEVDGKVLDNKCPNCGAPLFYNAETLNWKCNYCDSKFNLEQLQKFNNASSEENNETASEIEYQPTNENVNFINYTCQNCGAEIVADEQTAATFCVYCGNTAILKNKLSGEFAPDLIIPFKKAKKTANAAFASLSKGRPLMPKGFNDEKNIEKIKGVYIPFWLYDINVAGALNYDAQRVISWSTGNTIYTKTEYFYLIREGSMSYQKIPMDSSTRFDNDIMNSIEPFDYKDLIKYNHAYLSGFLAEKYDDDEAKIQEAATKRAINSTIDQINSTARIYTSKQIISNTLEPTSINRNYALLPVWMVNVKYNNKQYIFAMNGQTGKFIGNIPIDKKKALIIGIAVFIITFIVVILVSLIIYVCQGGKL